jgi:microcystin-dependent protein
VQLSTSPKTHTTLRLEQRKSFAFGIRFVDTDEKPLDLTGATIRFVAAQPAHLGGASVLEAEADVVVPAEGLGRFDIQASDLAMPAGEYPFGVVFVSSIGYSTLVIKGVIDLQENTESESISSIYEGINPDTTLQVVLEAGQLVQVTIERIDGFSLVVEERIAEFTAQVETLLDGALAEADEYISEANLAAISAAASAQSAAASADAAAAMIEAAIGFDPYGLVPSGAGMEWYDDVPPTGWVMQDGSTVPRTGATAGIFARWGTKFGAGDGSTTFRLPNRAGTVPVAKKVSDVDFDAIGKTGGTKGTSLNHGHLPLHNHSMVHGHGASSGEAGSHDHNAVIAEGGVHGHDVPNVGYNEFGFHEWGFANGSGRTFSLADGISIPAVDGNHGHGIDIHHAGEHTHPVTVNNFNGSTGNTGTDTPAKVSAVQPYFVVNYIMKL